MANLPYVTSGGNVTKALHAIAAAATPDVVSQNFVKTILKIPGGSGDQMTSFLKKVGFANPDGSPSDIYRKFRNEGTRGAAAAASLKHGYAALYRRNEYAHELGEKDIRGLIVEETGQAADSQVTTYILSCFKAIRGFADFSKNINDAQQVSDQSIQPYIVPDRSDKHENAKASKSESSVGLSIGYNINLNLPATTDVAVFNAIFKSLKENLLRSDDA